MKSACRNCKHWQSDNDWGGYGVALDDAHYCMKAKMFWDATEWYDPLDASDWKPERRLTEAAKDDLMFVQDGSDYKAFLITRGDFFCAHFDALTSTAGCGKMVDHPKTGETHG